MQKNVTDALDTFAVFCGVDIFILGPKLTPTVDGLNGDVEVIRDQRWRVAIYGDIESTEHAKTQVLIFIDKLVYMILQCRSNGKRHGTNVGFSLDVN